MIAGYDDLEHMLSLMNSKWPITENVLKNEAGITKQAHRYKILAKLRIECDGFESMKKVNTTSRYKKDEIRFEKSEINVACDSCTII